MMTDPRDKPYDFSHEAGIRIGSLKRVFLAPDDVTVLFSEEYTIHPDGRRESHRKWAPGVAEDIWSEGGGT